MHYHVFVLGLAKMQYVIRHFSQQMGKAIHLRQTDGGENMRELLTEAKRKHWTNIIVDLTAPQTSLLLKMVIMLAPLQQSNFLTLHFNRTSL